MFVLDMGKYLDFHLIGTGWRCASIHFDLISLSSSLRRICLLISLLCATCGTIYIIFIYVFISILYFYYLQSLASNLILKSNWNHRNSLHMAAMRNVLLLGADLGLWLLCLLLLLFLSLLLLRLLLLLLLRILIHFCLCFVVAEHIFSLWQISAVSFSYFLLLLLLLFSFKHTNMYMHAHVYVRVRVADEIYLVNLVRRFVSANNDFLPFAYVMLPAALFPSMMCHN